jgi:hypothetical protein
MSTSYKGRKVFVSCEYMVVFLFVLYTNFKQPFSFVTPFFFTDLTLCPLHSVSLSYTCFLKLLGTFFLCETGARGGGGGGGGVTNGVLLITAIFLAPRLCNY